MNFSILNEEDLKIHANLVQITSIYTDALTAKANKPLWDDKDEQVSEFLSCLENIFCHQVKSGFRGSTKLKVWSLIVDLCAYLPETCVHLVNTLDNLKSNLAKLRVFFRIALQSKRFHVYLDVLLNATDVLRKYYQPNSVMLSRQLQTLMPKIAQLKYIDFCFDVRSKDLNFVGIRSINYAMYLSSNSSTASAFSAELINRDNEYLLFRQSTLLQSKLDKALKQKAHLEIALKESTRKLRNLLDEQLQSNKCHQSLQRAFDQLQMKFVLLHEEYSQKLRCLKSSPNLRSSYPSICSLDSFSLPCTTSTHQTDAGVEVTEDMNYKDLNRTFFNNFHHSIRSRNFFLKDHTPQPISLKPNNDCIQPPERKTQMSSKLNTQSNVISSSTPQLLPPTFMSFNGFTIGEQVISDNVQKYRLPNYSCSSPVLNDPPINLQSMSVTVKPKNINFCSRFALPQSTGVSRTNCMHLLSEIQTADNSFQISESSPFSETTSEQVSDLSDLGGQQADLKTVTNSTSTVKELPPSPLSDAFPTQLKDSFDTVINTSQLTDKSNEDYFTLSLHSEE